MAHFGMLEIRPDNGTFVRADNDLAASLTRRIAEDALEGLEARNSLERDAARLATRRRRTDADLAALREHLLAQHEAYERDDVDQYAEADVSFHQALMAAAHNHVLDELYDNLTITEAHHRQRRHRTAARARTPARLTCRPRDRHRTPRRGRRRPGC